MDHVSSNNVVVSPKVYPAKKTCRSEKLHLDPISFTLLRKCEAKFQSQARLWSSSSSKTAASNSKILLTTDIVGKKKLKNLPSSSSSQHQKFQIPNFFKLCGKPNSQNPSSSSFEGSFFMGKKGNWSCAATKPKSVSSPTPKKNSGIRSYNSGGIVPIS